MEVAVTDELIRTKQLENMVSLRERERGVERGLEEYPVCETL